jgi:hypothetical protein
MSRVAVSTMTCLQVHSDVLTYWCPPDTAHCSLFTQYLHCLCLEHSEPFTRRIYFLLQCTWQLPQWPTIVSILTWLHLYVQLCSTQLVWLSQVTVSNKHAQSSTDWTSMSHDTWHHHRVCVCVWHSAARSWQYHSSRHCIEDLVDIEDIGTRSLAQVLVELVSASVACPLHSPGGSSWLSWTQYCS